MAKLYKDGLVHPDLVAQQGRRRQDSCSPSGKIVFMQDGMGVLAGACRPSSRRSRRGFNMQPVPIFSATGGDPLVWGDDEPISYTFIKKGLGKDRVEELLRVINWCSAPFGTQEFAAARVRRRGQAPHAGPPTARSRPTWASRRSPNQYFFISGRSPVVQPTPETPNYVQDMLAYSNDDGEVPGEGPVGRASSWRCRPTYQGAAGARPRTRSPTSCAAGARCPTSTPSSRSGSASGGDEARDFLAKALSDAGR